MRIADVSPGRLWCLIHQEKSISDVANVHKVPELLFHQTISWCERHCRPHQAPINWTNVNWKMGETTSGSDQLNRCELENGWDSSAEKRQWTCQEINQDRAACVHCGLQQGPDHQGWAKWHHVQSSFLGVGECFELCQGLGKAVPVLAQWNWEETQLEWMKNERKIYFTSSNYRISQIFNL